jgi:phosphomannomutase
MNPRYRLISHAWEAVYTEEFTLDQVRQRGALIADSLAERGWSCLVAYDTRFMGNLFARALSADLNARGVRSRLAAAPTPLPAVHYALDRKLADCALVVTARKRPYYYNGLVLIAPAPGVALVPDGAAPAEQSFAPLIDSGPAPVDQPDLRGDHLESLRGAVDIELVRRVSLTIFVDAMNGTAAGVFPALLGEGAQTRAIEINREPDPLFGKITPHPAEAGLNRLKKLVRESDSHLGLAISGDGTALAVIDKTGEQLDPTELSLLLGSYLARQHRHRGPLVAPVPAPGSALAMLRTAAWEEANGLKAELTATPDARIIELLEQERPSLLLGSSAEGEISIGRIAAYPDAMLAGLLVAEMVARSGGSLRALIDAQREQLK